VKTLSSSPSTAKTTKKSIGIKNYIEVGNQGYQG
jgi:hypothetical protein